MSKTTTGSCLCGAVKMEARGEPLRVMHCHCPSCRKATGAAFATFVDYTSDSVTFSGTGMKMYTSSPGVTRRFCGDCGSTISYQGDNWPDEINISLGFFDNPEVFTPQSHCYVKTALPWLHMDDGLPKVKTFSTEEQDGE